MEASCNAAFVGILQFFSMKSVWNLTILQFCIVLFAKRRYEKSLADYSTGKTSRTASPF